MTGSITTAGTPSALENFVASIQHLPLFTGMAAQLVRSVERDDISASELARQIATDAALAAQLLRLVNAPYYGLRRRIGTVPDAIAVLGFDMVRRVVTAAVLERPIRAYLHDTAIARAFWRHQLLCAGLARHLNARKGEGGEAAYMAGLLHDVGRLVMVMKYPEASDDLLQALDDQDGVPAIERERRRFGFDHALVGAALLELWGVPEAMVISTGQHADATEPDHPMAASVWHANRFAHRIEDADGQPLDPALLDVVGLSEAACRLILDEVDALEGGG